MIARIIRWRAMSCSSAIATAIVTLVGLYAVQKVPLDAIPISPTSRSICPHRVSRRAAPQVVEDQVTYPLTTAMLTVPKARTVRLFFGVSFVYVIFDDGTDIYWARSRVMESLSAAAGDLPSGVTPNSAPMQPASAGSISTSCAGNRRASPSSARCRTGMCATVSRKRMASQRWRASAVSSNSTA